MKEAGPLLQWRERAVAPVIDIERAQLVRAAADRILGRMGSFCRATGDAEGIGVYREPEQSHWIDMYSDRMELRHPTSGATMVRYDSISEIVYPAKECERDAMLTIVFQPPSGEREEVRVPFSWRGQFNDAYEFGRFVHAARRAWVRG